MLSWWYRNSDVGGCDVSSANLRLDHFDGETDSPNNEIVKGFIKDDKPIMIMTPDDTIGRTFLASPTDDRQRYRG